ncbi:MAG: transglycosylase SLT domain-containing protein [Acidobacteria bacterium]|jgi:membrane-bound lytic murein transglycosylase D|nr:transglycosylase SLT domain-containing protein [Acidobacteriota bacterium]
MSKARSWLLSAVLLLLAACSPSRSALRPAPGPMAVQGPSERAESFFQSGKASLEKGDMAGAKACFDQSLDALLAAGGSAMEVDRGALNDMVKRIADIELNYLKDKNSPENGEHEAFLDQVIATPLFLPSAQDVQDLQQKVGETAVVAYSLPVIVNSQVVSFLKAFQTIRHEGIQRALDRMGEFIGPFKETLRRYGVPEDLAYLPIIESGFRVDATSRARARGAWQFMAATARLFGLRVDWQVDERLDPFKAADAAARFLKHLHDEYGDWYIALACYNGGPRRVERAMRALQTADFFTINQSRHIRRETKNYVPAFLASLIIARSPAEYGFTLGGGVPLFAGCKTVEVPSPVSLALVAERLQLSAADLKKLNPELLRDFTPSNKTVYSLRVPATADEAALAGLERIPASRIPRYNSYRVRPGDTLSTIARRHGTSVSRIQAANNLRSTLIRPGMNLIIPGRE